MAKRQPAEIAVFAGWRSHWSIPTNLSDAARCTPVGTTRLRELTRQQTGHFDVLATELDVNTNSSDR